MVDGWMDRYIKSSLSLKMLRNFFFFLTRPRLEKKVMFPESMFSVLHLFDAWGGLGYYTFFHIAHIRIVFSFFIYKYICERVYIFILYFN